MDGVSKVWYDHAGSGGFVAINDILGTMHGNWVAPSAMAAWSWPVRIAIFQGRWHLNHDVGQSAHFSPWKLHYLKFKMCLNFWDLLVRIHLPIRLFEIQIEYARPYNCKYDWNGSFMISIELFIWPSLIQSVRCNWKDNWEQANRDWIAGHHPFPSPLPTF